MLRACAELSFGEKQYLLVEVVTRMDLNALTEGTKVRAPKEQPQFSKCLGCSLCSIGYRCSCLALSKSHHLELWVRMVSYRRSRNFALRIEMLAFRTP